MKVAIDASAVIYGSGVSKYTEGLIQALSKVDKENEYVLFGGSLRRFSELKQSLSKLSKDFINAETKAFPFAPTFTDLIWNKLHFIPIESLIGKIDIFHSSDWTQPQSSAYKVTTIHDLVPIKYPKLSHPKIVAAHKKRLAWVKAEVDCIIVPSEATKADLADLGWNAGKIVVIPEAPDEMFFPASKARIDKVKRKYSIEDDYLFAIGVGERKNTARIIKAFNKINIKKNLSLVIAGEIRGRVENVKGVSYLGYIDDEDLPALYTGAKALLYPSIYEGYGLPILQAFACKCPVVTSNISCMPEVAGDAAVLVDPNSVNSIAEGIQKALDDRAGLIRRGFTRSKNFSWQVTAKKTLEIYNRAGGM